MDYSWLSSTPRSRSGPVARKTLKVVFLGFSKSRELYRNLINKTRRRLFSTIKYVNYTYCNIYYTILTLTSVRRCGGIFFEDNIWTNGYQRMDFSKPSVHLAFESLFQRYVYDFSSAENVHSDGR